MRRGGRGFLPLFLSPSPSLLPLSPLLTPVILFSLPLALLLLLLPLPGIDISVDRIITLPTIFCGVFIPLVHHTQTTLAYSSFWPFNYRIIPPLSPISPSSLLSPLDAQCASPYLTFLSLFVSFPRVTHTCAFSLTILTRDPQIGLALDIWLCVRMPCWGPTYLSLLSLCHTLNLMQKE